MNKTTPMLCSPATDVPSGEDWIAEPKYDGWRAIFHKSGMPGIGTGVPTLYTRTGKIIDTVPYLLDALMEVPDGTMLDGEIVNLAHGHEWNRTQELLSRKAPHVPSATDPPLTFVLFDVLELDHEDVKREELAQRRKLLKLLHRLIGADTINLVPEVTCLGNAGELMYQQAVEDGLEGIVCKRLSSVYAPGGRNGAWVKIKPVSEMDVEVTGTYEPTAGSKYDGNAVGGITFLAHHNDGKTYAGQCAGMDNVLREALLTEPESYEGRVAVVAFQSVGKDGALRFPRFVRFRDPADKPVEALVKLSTLVEPIPEPTSAGARVLMQRCLDAEERVGELEEQVSDLTVKLSASVRLNEEYESKKRSRAKPGAVTPRARGVVTTGAPGGTQRRNYAAMGDEKLRGALADFRAKRGDAYERALATEANGGWTVGEHITEATKIARMRGITP